VPCRPGHIHYLSAVQADKFKIGQIQTAACLVKKKGFKQEIFDWHATLQ
jgi:hypothetical protein